MTPEQERASYEAWFSDGGESPRAIERDSGCGYKLAQAQSAWVVWQEAGLSRAQAEQTDWRAAYLDAVAQHNKTLDELREAQGATCEPCGTPNCPEHGIPLSAQAVAAWLVSGDGHEMRAFITQYEVDRWIAQQKKHGSPYHFTTAPLYTAPQPAEAQEPVGKLIRGEGGAFRYGFPDKFRPDYAMPQGEHPLYTAPPTRQPLSDAEILACERDADAAYMATRDHELRPAWGRLFARAIERHHGITDTKGGQHGRS